MKMEGSIIGLYDYYTPEKMAVDSLDRSQACFIPPARKDSPGRFRPNWIDLLKDSKPKR